MPVPPEMRRRLVWWLVGGAAIAAGALATGREHSDSRWRRVGAMVVASRARLSDGYDADAALRRWDAAGALFARGVELVVSALVTPDVDSADARRHRGSSRRRDLVPSARRQVALRSGVHRWRTVVGRETVRRARRDGLVTVAVQPGAVSDHGYAEVVDVAAQGTDPGNADPGPDYSGTTAVIDLDAIEVDLSDVEVALARLEAGTYWTCEVTGQPLPDDLMAREPLRRRLP
jgi:hypothetical protein